MTNGTMTAEQTAEILHTLREEGVNGPEELKDLIFDYRLAAQQNESMRQKFCVPDKVIIDGTFIYCPECGETVRYWMRRCGKCGKAISMPF